MHWHEGRRFFNLLELSDGSEDYERTGATPEGRNTTPRAVSLLQLGSFNSSPLTGSPTVTWEGREIYSHLNEFACNREEFLCVPISQS